jgi:hypothetical protein
MYLREGNGDGGYLKEVEFRKFLSKQYVLNVNQKMKTSRLKRNCIKHHLVGIIEMLKF